MLMKEIKEALPQIILKKKQFNSPIGAKEQYGLLAKLSESIDYIEGTVITFLTNTNIQK